MKKDRMKTKSFMGVVFSLVLGFSVLSGSLWASVEVSFKLSGSFGYLQDGAGDIDKARRGIEAAIFELNQNDSYSSTFSWEKPSRINDFRAELVFRVSRNFGISIGSGYILAKNNGNYSIDYNYNWDNGNQYSQKSTENLGYSRSYDVASIPITIDAYLFLPIGKKETFKIFAHVGVGYYFGTLQHTMDMDGTFSSKRSYNGTLEYQNEGTSNSQLTEKTNSNSWGYHGGLGLDIKLTRVLSFGAEVYGRHVEFLDWEGSQVINTEYKNISWSPWRGEKVSENSYADSAYGKMWTYEVENSKENENFAMMAIRDEKPNARYYQNIRKSSINLNSYGLSVSVKLSFNLF